MSQFSKLHFPKVQPSRPPAVPLASRMLGTEKKLRMEEQMIGKRWFCLGRAPGLLERQGCLRFAAHALPPMQKQFYSSFRVIV